MGKPIYVCFRATPLEAWYQLSQQERDAMIAKLQASMQQVGSKSVIPICTSRWTSEAWAFFGVEEYPDIEALQRHTQLQEDMNWYRYMKSETLVGTVWEQPA